MAEFWQQKKRGEEKNNIQYQTHISDCLQSVNVIDFRRHQLPYRWLNFRICLTHVEDFHDIPPRRRHLIECIQGIIRLLDVLVKGRLVFRHAMLSVRVEQLAELILRWILCEKKVLKFTMCLNIPDNGV